MGKVQDRNWCDDGELPNKLASLPILSSDEEDESGGERESAGAVLFEQLYPRSRERRCPARVNIPELEVAGDGR
jgi:hypothetical protein